jgi:hypothetical protein
MPPIWVVCVDGLVVVVGTTGLELAQAVSPTTTTALVTAAAAKRRIKLLGQMSPVGNNSTDSSSGTGGGVRCSALFTVH